MQSLLCLEHNMDFINPIVFQPSMLTSSGVTEADYPEWAATTFFNKDTSCILGSQHKIYKCLVDHQSTNGNVLAVTITIASPGVISWTAHGLLTNTQVVFTTTGALPTGLLPGVVYYVVSPATNTFSLALTPGGSAINTSGTQSGTHTLTAPSTNPLTNLTGASPKWLEVGATNRFAMFDDKFGTQTTKTSGGTTTLTVVITPGLALDSIALLNMLGTTLTINCTVAGVTIYNEVITLQTDIGVFDWKSYFLAPIVAEADVILTDLLPYNLQVITITLVGTGTVAIGNVAMGAKVTLGGLEYNPTLGIIDYSTKSTDAYGNIIVVKRAYSKRFGGRFVCNNNYVDQLAAILASVRSTPVVWIGSNTFGSLIVWGFYKDFEIDIAYPTMSYCSITIEGLA
jgi:hypothetical protein